MVMVVDLLPGFKGFLKRALLPDASQALVSRMVVAFLLHAGRMSCLAAAGAVRSEPVHRAQIARFLARPRWRGRGVNSLVRQDLLDREAVRGKFVFIIDATLCGQAGQKTENTYSPEGLVEVVTADDQACSGDGQMGRLSAIVSVPDRAESEITDVLRPPGKARGPLGRPSPARLFDNERESENCRPG